MATRRAIPKANDDLQTKIEDDALSNRPGASDTSPAVPAHVIFKLLGFTLAMVVVPLGSYFVTLDLVFGGNATLAGATAAIMANVVLVGYIIVAFREDDGGSAGAAAAEDRKKL